jgi:hypothetical protein
MRVFGALWTDLGVQTHFQYLHIESDRYSIVFLCFVYTLTLLNPHILTVLSWAPAPSPSVSDAKADPNHGAVLGAQEFAPKTLVPGK